MKINMKWMLLALLQGPIAAHAAATPWAGDWELDRAASSFKGDVTVIQQTPAGYQFDFGAVQFTLADDGQFHPTTPGRATRLLKIGPHSWQREHQVNGRVVDQSLLTVSEPGDTLTIAGEHGAGAEVLRRIGPGTGLAGAWRSTRLGINAAPALALSDAGAHRLRWDAPAEGNYYVVTIDGAPAVNQGPTASSIATLQMTTARDGSLHWTERLNGKDYRLGTDQLSPDGKVLTETAWPAALPDEKQVLVYRRKQPG